MRLIITTALFVSLGAASAGAGQSDLPMVTRDEQGRTTVRAVRVSEPLRIDGRLDEAIYRAVPPVSDFVETEPQNGRPAEERTALSAALGLLYAIAGAHSPLGADRAGNYLDLGVDGRMDCIDHSTSTTRLLRLIEGRGWLRFHRVATPARRARFIFQHFSAVIEEGRASGGRYAIDSWFVNNGEAAVVLPLAEWLEGGGPNVH